MQLRLADVGGRHRVTVRTRGLEARRLWATLFVLSIVPPVAWGVASAAERNERRPAPSDEMIRRSSEQAEPLLLAASIARAPAAESVTAAAARSQATPRRAGAGEVRERTASSKPSVYTPAPVVGGRFPNPVVGRESGPELRAQAEKAPAALGFETGSALTRSSESSSTDAAESAATQPDEAKNPSDAYFRPIPRDEAAVGVSGGATEETRTVGGVELAPGMDYGQLRAAPPTRRMRTAMHRVAASTAAALSSQNAFGTAMEAGRFQSNPAGAAFVERGLDQAAEAVEVVPGVRLEGVALSAGYSSNGIPGSRLVGFGNQVGSDYDMGVQATFAYRHRGRSSNLSILYRPTHLRRARLSEWNTTNHDLSLSVTKDIGRRWAVGGSASGRESGLEQFFIEAPVFRTLSSAPPTLTDLFDQAASGVLSDDEFASVLTGTPVVDQPANRRLSLARALSLSARANASYSYSPRITFDFSASVSRYELRNNAFLRSAQQGAFYFNSLSSQSLSAEASYRLSGRRTISLSERVSLRGGLGPFGSQTASSTQFSWKEQLGRSWSYTLSGGLGVIDGVGRIVFDPNDPAGLAISPITNRSRRQTWVASGKLQYRLGSHSLSVSAGRRVGDTFNFGNRTALNGRVGWNWNPRRSPWNFQAGASYFQSSRGNAFNGVRGFQSRLVSAGLGRTLTPTTALQADLYFGYYNTPYSGLFSNNSTQRVQVSWVWRPTPNER